MTTTIVVFEDRSEPVCNGTYRRSSTMTDEFAAKNIFHSSLLLSTRITSKSRLTKLSRPKDPFITVEQWQKMGV